MIQKGLHFVSFVKMVSVKDAPPLLKCFWS